MTRTETAQRVASYAMGVMFVALATAVVLRTGALQMFARALHAGVTNSGGKATAGSGSVAALAWLSPSFKRQLRRGPLSAATINSERPPRVR